ncbi:K02A2.6-like [Cordylochernes scorpioides]|uniref:RNA-directed DNA polymerase n=1 Tax=Cordylochernes scorpioides TaxID=51811 RepID=A0ABY6LZC0_9ARAC|nr:K02A2.6-like [Cordylochernes scorpioides]
MADLLQDLEGTENSMDDILIHAPDPQTLEIRTRAVLQRLKENGIKLNGDKCKFQLQEVQYLGHIVTTEGIRIDPEKVRAIGEIKSPSNKQELQRLLGMIQYLSRFIPNLAEKTKNMRLLLKKDTPWLWDESLDCDLLEIKTLLRTAPSLKFFNPNGNLTLSVDASSYALGAVLLQNGKPIAYASSALNSTQQNYAQIEKEALAIKFGCDKFHQLIYGKTVDVETDHQAIKAPPRLQRIFLQIQQYDLRIKYKKGKELLTADLLSRDCSYEDTYLEENFEVLMTTPTNKSSYEELQALTKEDQELQELKNLILYGWPNYKSAVPESCKKYWPYRDELSTNEDLIFKGSRVFIPLKWKAKILKLIHEGHQGTNRCLRRARDSIYWHGMSQDIINTVENCRTCQANQRNKTPIPSIDEIFSKLSTSTVLSTLDLSQAYLQVMLAEEAKADVDINTTKRLFSYKRLPYDVAVAPNKFQRIMEGLFSDFPVVACYIDDILVAGKYFEDYEQKLDLMFSRKKRYSQLEKEALSITYGDEKSRQYLLGRKFVLFTDNRPLIHIFSPQKPIPICAASRIKRWTFILAAFNYTEEFRKGSDYSNVDAFSRLPLESSVRKFLDEDRVLLLRELNEVPFSFREVAYETSRDKILSIVLRNVREGNCVCVWKFTRVLRENPLAPYYKINEELNGIFWWPGIDSNIKELTRECRVCQESASMPPATISEWTWPEKPWHRLHLDLAGPFMGRMFLVLVDAYSKWIEIFIIKDNQKNDYKQFVSGEFEQFTKMNGIRHTKTSPYNPSSNGLAERYVREFKNFLRKNNGKDDLDTNLQSFLFAHRASP